MKKRDKIIYMVATGLFSLMISAGAVIYFVQYEMTRDMFVSLGVPEEVIYPLAIAKILGILTIWLIKNHTLKVLAYACFALELVLAILSHINAGDGGAFNPVVPLLLLVVSYVYYRKRLKESGQG